MATNTISEITYALMAGRAYQTTRADVNKFPVPDGWSEPIDKRKVVEASGFEAGYFTRGTGANTEIVISFAGTGNNGDWIHGNIPLAAGNLSDQLRQAADYYLQVKASAPAGATISFTGHSLGGGLASLMAILFGESATTFDQAPFRNSALNFTTTDASGNVTPHFVAQDLKGYLTSGQSAIASAMPPATLASLLTNLDAYIAAPNIANELAAREAKVTDINVQGEILGYLPFSRIGSQADLKQQNNMNIPVDAQIDLHSQALLTAMLQSGDTASSTIANHTLGQASFKLPDLLKMMFDPKLFAYPVNTANTTDRNFIENLVRHQAGGIGGVPTGGDAMVTRFTSDLWKLAQDGGLTLTDQNASNAGLNELSKALTAFAMQYYYEDTANAKAPNKQLFTDLGTEGGSNGIRFDLHDVSQDIAAQMDANKQIDLAVTKDGKYLLKGYEYLLNYLNQGEFQFNGQSMSTGGGFTMDERAIIKSMLPAMRDWYVQAGAGGMIATDTLNRGAFMLGGSGADALTGGSKADLLVGNAGADLLQGRGGNDMLIGGTGNDAYVYTSGDGLDTILDSDGQGSIVMDGQTVNGGDQYGDARVHRSADGKHTYTDVGRGLVIDGNIFVESWQAGQLGITLNSNPVAQPTAVNTIQGDLTPTNFGADALGNIITDPNSPQPGRADNLTGSTNNDILIGGGGGDAGDDVLNSGAGSDVLIGGGGVDTCVLNSGTNQGVDTVLDSDNAGYLRDDTSFPIVLSGGEQFGDNRVFQGKDANGKSHLYTFVTGNRTIGGDLMVDGAMLIKDYKPGQGNGMGLSFSDAFIRVANDETANAWRDAA